ncbi:spore coat protein U domain-containing protein [Pseudomonas sp. CBSPGW29]|nr:spore coat protein U domain-containing protein [Pseudomonas sp. CBSPGW29]
MQPGHAVSDACRRRPAWRRRRSALPGRRRPSIKPIPYRIYADAARRIPLAVDVPVSGRVPDSGTVDLPLYGRIEPLKEIPAVGRYSDLLKVTVTW